MLLVDNQKRHVFKEKHQLYYGSCTLLVYKHWLYDAQPKLTINVARCFVLRANLAFFITVGLPVVFEKQIAYV
jgi:hypothetical protein